jgi:hypothetical protein
MDEKGIYILQSQFLERGVDTIVYILGGHEMWPYFRSNKQLFSFHHRIILEPGFERRAYFLFIFIARKCGFNILGNEDEGKGGTYYHAQSRCLYPASKAAITASVICSRLSSKVPNPNAGIIIPLFIFRVGILEDIFSVSELPDEESEGGKSL